MSVAPRAQVSGPKLGRGADNTQVFADDLGARQILVCSLVDGVRRFLDPSV